MEFLLSNKASRFENMLKEAEEECKIKIPKKFHSDLGIENTSN